MALLLPSSAACTCQAPMHISAARPFQRAITLLALAVITCNSFTASPHLPNADERVLCSIRLTILDITCFRRSSSIRSATISSTRIAHVLKAIVIPRCCKRLMIRLISPLVLFSFTVCSCQASMLRDTHWFTHRPTTLSAFVAIALFSTMFWCHRPKPAESVPCNIRFTILDITCFRRSSSRPWSLALMTPRHQVCIDMLKHRLRMRITICLIICFFRFTSCVNIHHVFKKRPPNWFCHRLRILHIFAWLPLFSITLSFQESKPSTRTLFRIRWIQRFKIALTRRLSFTLICHMSKHFAIWWFIMRKISLLHDFAFWEFSFACIVSAWCFKSSISSIKRKVVSECCVEAFSCHLRWCAAWLTAEVNRSHASRKAWYPIVDSTFLIASRFFFISWTRSTNESNAMLRLRCIILRIIRRPVARCRSWTSSRRTRSCHRSFKKVMSSSQLSSTSSSHRSSSFWSFGPINWASSTWFPSASVDSCADERHLRINVLVPWRRSFALCSCMEKHLNALSSRQIPILWSNREYPVRRFLLSSDHICSRIKEFFNRSRNIL